MGRRHHEQIFLPNKFVFPGGRVQRGDSAVTSANEPAREEVSRLLLDMKGRPSVARARALALAAIRETFEETGLLIGQPPNGPATTSSEPWRTFLAEGFVPNPGALSYFARAITPPGRARRYDTRFFIADAASIAFEHPAQDGELSNLDWFTVQAARKLELASITRVLLEDIAQFVVAPPKRACRPIPYYYNRNGSLRRDLLGNTLATP